MILEKKEIQKNIISKNVICKDALILLEKLQYKFLVILNNKLNVIGTLTDGDIRRGFSNGLSIKDRAYLFANQKPVFYDYRKIKIKSKHLEFIPLTKKNKLHSIKLNFQKKKYIIENKTPFIIMAGGEGKRMGKLTRNLPKPMLIAGENIILDQILTNAIKKNFDNFYLFTHFKSSKITNYIKKNYKFLNNIKVIKETKPQGTVGGIINNKHLFKKAQTIIVHNGDIITGLDYNKMLKYHYENKSLITLSIKENKVTSLHGELKIKKNKISNIEEKPTRKYFYASGIYIIDIKLLNLFKKKINYLDMPDFIKLILKKNIKVLPFLIYESSKEFTYADDLRK